MFVAGFWDMYDPEGYSLWFCDYKYNDENTVSFVTLNKVGGFLQRMDLARKYAFGKMLVIGSEPPFKVKGLWLFRGQEIPQFVLDECYDMELYEWKKVDITDEEQKERVSQMIEDYEPFEGQPLLDAKCFKWMTPISPWIKVVFLCVFAARVFIDAVLNRLSLVFLCLSGGLV